MSHSPSDGDILQDPADALRTRLDELFPQLVDDLERLVRIPSVSGPGAPPAPLFEAHDLVVRLLRDAGVDDVEDLVIEGKTAPVVIARVPAPPGAPTVLLYTHYDVVPSGEESLWSSPPFEPTHRDGAVYGRGTADSKGNLVALIGALRLLDGHPPCGVTVVLEGQEEIGSPFDHYPPTAPETFRSDVVVVKDVGNVRPGTPTLTVSLRGSATVTVELRTMAGDVHSGLYGGAAPDARLALVHLLASLHDTTGDVVVPGLLREPWPGATFSEEQFRELTETLQGVPLLGSGGLGEHIWSGPAVTVIGFDAPGAAEPLNAVAGHARAVLNLRVHPRQPAAEAQAALVTHLRAQRPFGLVPEVTPGEVGDGFAADTDGPAYAVATRALEDAWGAPVQHMAGGGSIPLVMALHEAVPAAEKLLFGATDSYAAIHAPDERILLSELRATTLATALLLVRLGERAGVQP